LNFFRNMWTITKILNKHLKQSWENGD
jgi:hypothetical protein